MFSVRADRNSKCEISHRFTFVNDFLRNKLNHLAQFIEEALREAVGPGADWSCELAAVMQVESHSFGDHLEQEPGVLQCFFLNENE